MLSCPRLACILSNRLLSSTSFYISLSNYPFRYYSNKSMSREPVQITSNSIWEDNVKNKKGLVLVDFSAEWCGPCRMLEPVLKKVCELSDFEHVHFVKADIDKNPSLANSHDVTAVPTILLFKDGKVIHRHQGLVNEKGLKDLLRKFDQ